MSTTIDASPDMSTLTRTESVPSTTSEPTVVTHSPPLSIEEIIVLEEKQAVQDEVAEVKRGLGKLYPSKSMPGLKVNQAATAGEWKARALSGTDGKTTIVMPRPAPQRSMQSTPIVPTQQSKTQPVKSKGGFSALLRRFTGRSNSAPKSRPAPSPIPSPIVEEKTRPVVMAQPMARSTSASNVPTKPVLVPLNVNIVPDHLAPFSAPAATQPGAILAGPVPMTPVQRDIDIRPVDPCEIPLPPSPVLDAVIEEDNLIASNVSLAPPISTESTVLAGNEERYPLPSLSESEEEEDEELSEKRDDLRALQPIRIPSGGFRNTPDTPTTASSAIEQIITPTSTSGSPPRQSKAESESPPRKIHGGAGNELGRKESKWRRSVMNFGDYSNPKRNQRTSVSPPPMEKRYQEPPTSYDAYLAHQQRIAKNRVSCQPTLHSQASIAAELRQIRDKEESDMAEVFYLS